MVVLPALSSPSTCSQRGDALKFRKAGCCLWRSPCGLVLHQVTAQPRLRAPRSSPGCRQAAGCTHQDARLLVAKQAEQAREPEPLRTGARSECSAAAAAAGGRRAEGPASHRRPDRSLFHSSRQRPLQAQGRRGPGSCRSRAACRRGAVNRLDSGVVDSAPWRRRQPLQAPRPLNGVATRRLGGLTMRGRGAIAR